jgi:hypothetical protein
MSAPFVLLSCDVAGRDGVSEMKLFDPLRVY